jgi:hypothetical protein
MTSWPCRSYISLCSTLLVYHAAKVCEVVHYSSNAWSSSNMWVMIAWTILLFLLRMLSPTLDEHCQSVGHILYFVLCIREKDEVMDNVQIVSLLHDSPQYPFLFPSVDVFMSQQMASRKRKGYSKHHRLTPIRTLNDFVSYPPVKHSAGSFLHIGSL